MIFQRKASTPLYRTVHTQTPNKHGTMDESWNSMAPNGTRTGTIEVAIDLDAIVAKLGRKALLAKTRRAVGLNGLVKVRVIGKAEDAGRIE